MTPTANPSGEQQTLLIVDDETINLQMLCTQFQGTYRVLIAKSGSQALERLQSEHVDLILLDICMADIDGYEVLNRIKKLPDCCDIPVIFITAKTDSREEMIGLQLGAVDYIGKPLQLPIVEVRVRTHMALKRKTELLERLASVDGLTEIYNRRHFDTELIKEWQRSQRTGEPLSLVMIDVDYFKRFNDSAGHSSGDYCLRQVALYLSRACLRSCDTLVRYGGEEFAIIAPNTSQVGAEELSQRCLESLHSAHITHPDSPISDCVTLSIGAASMTKDFDLHSPDALIKKADECLYQSKKKGRNDWNYAAL